MSGFSRSMMATASLPEPASPTTDDVVERAEQRDQERARRPFVVGDHDPETCAHIATSGVTSTSAEASTAAGFQRSCPRRECRQSRATRPFRTGIPDGARCCAGRPRRRGPAAALPGSNPRRCHGRSRTVRECRPTDDRSAPGSTLRRRLACLAMPCFTAFSTSGCSTSGGTRMSRNAVGTSMVTLQPLFEPGALDVEVRLDDLELAARAW